MRGAGCIGGRDLRGFDFFIILLIVQHRKLFGGYTHSQPAAAPTRRSVCDCAAARPQTTPVAPTFGVFEHGARDGDALLLTPAQLHAPLAHLFWGWLGSRGWLRDQEVGACLPQRLSVGRKKASQPAQLGRQGTGPKGAQRAARTHLGLHAQGQRRDEARRVGGARRRGDLLGRRACGGGLGLGFDLGLGRTFRRGSTFERGLASSLCQASARRPQGSARRPKAGPAGCGGLTTAKRQRKLAAHPACRWRCFQRWRS
jgi:hypothetical protein